jgi:cell division septum initiation protein DivIVA
MSRSGGRSTAKTAGHRIRFHLAPLVDLLLIIVFAQFLEIRTTVRDQTIALKRQIAQADQQAERLRAEGSISREQQQAERERTMKAVGTIAEIFDLSKQQVREFATHSDADAAEILRRVAEQAQSISTDSPEKVIRFLVGHQELLKRAEIWNLHVGGDRKVTLSFADQQLRFGLERKGQDARTTEFEDALFAAYKQLPQPKELVVILASYSPDAVAGIYQPMIDGTPRALERMRIDDPTTRFEYTVLGATASPVPSETTEPTPTGTAQ